MTRLWTIVGVMDVPASMRWYQTLLGQPLAEPAHAYSGQIRDADGTVVLALFRVDDYEAALTRARALVPRCDEEPHVNPNTRTREFALRDPDGYSVTISEH